MAGFKGRIVQKLGGFRQPAEIIGRLYHALSGATVPDGHYYSPVPSLDDVRAHDAEIFGRTDTAGVDLHDDAQVALFTDMAGAFSTNPWQSSASGMRYTFDNTYFGRFDALVLHAILRNLSPQRVIEIGSGYSSAVILDTNDLFFDGQMSCTFIEPYPERLFGLLRDEDDRSMVQVKPLQEFDLGSFDELEKGDVVFIDSSHVSKVGSDVNLEVLSILPRTPPGVWIHIHDVFFPFEYPREWVYKGRYWNEAYLLHAFLAFNECFAIRCWNSYLDTCHPEVVEPLIGGVPDRVDAGSIWIERVS